MISKFVKSSFYVLQMYLHRIPGAPGIFFFTLG